MSTGELWASLKLNQTNSAYHPTRHGFISMSWGPLSTPGGWTLAAAGGLSSVSQGSAAMLATRLEYTHRLVYHAMWAQPIGGI